MAKRSVNLLAAGSLLLVVVGGVVYAAFGFTSVFSCDEGSNCFMGSFFAPASEAPDAGAPSSATLTSVPVPPAQPPTVEAMENARVPPGAGASPQPASAPFDVPSAPNAENSLNRVQAASPAAPEPPPVEEAAAPPPVAEEAPATDSSAAVVTPLAEVPAAPIDPEPGVLTDPPAGVVLDESATPGTPPPGNAPNIYVPILIFPPPGNAPRAR